jgi:hypothetical protein
MALKLKIGNGRYYLLLCFIACIAYWPLAFHIFSLKNDALTYFLPYRYQVSEAVHNGYFPFWSPYIYTGLPLHADMQSGAWNPVVLLLSLIRKYDMRVLQWETLLYIIIGGVGFFKLSRFFGFAKETSMLLSVSYSCCGFMIDSCSFIPWVTAAAWLPFCFLYFLKTTEKPQFPDALKLALSLSFLFLAGYPSFFIFCFYIILFSTLVKLVRLYVAKKHKAAVSLAKYLSLSALAGLLICLPALLSYIDFLSYYERGKGASLEMANNNPFVIDNALSYFFPPASYRLFTPNDISSRNAYLGIIPLLFFFYSLKFPFTRYQNILAALTIICFLFSLGEVTPVRAFFYHVLPLMNSFRHPATIRLFTTTGILLLSGYGIQAWIKNPDKAFLKKIILTALVICLIFTGYSLFFSGAANDIIQYFKNFELKGSVIKGMLDSSSAAFWLSVTGLIQLAFLILLLAGKKIKFISGLSVLNLIVMTFLCMPFTLVSKYRTREVNAYIKSWPSGFPPEKAWQNVENPVNDPLLLTSFGYESFYTKTISLQDHIVSPTVNKAYDEMLGDTARRSLIAKHPFAWFDNGDSLLLAVFTPNSFTFLTYNHTNTTLHLTQQYNHNWKAYAGELPLTIERDQKAFMKISLPAGTSLVRFVYRPIPILVAAIISWVLLLGCIGLLVYFRGIKDEKTPGK